MAQAADKLGKKKSKAKSKAKPKRKPKNKVKATNSKPDLTRCAHCSVMYGEGSDKRREDDWVQCLGCKAWFHKSCAEVVGILEEAERLNWFLLFCC